MSLENAPPSRYRVVERDRKLVTIDTLTGQVVGHRVQPPPPPSRPLDAPPTGIKDSATHRPSAMDPIQQTASAPFQGLQSGNNKSGRVAIVVVAGIFIAIMLIVTYLWVFVAIAFYFAPTRQILWPALRDGVTKFVNEGG